MNKQINRFSCVYIYSFFFTKFDKRRIEKTTTTLNSDPRIDMIKYKEK